MKISVGAGRTTSSSAICNGGILCRASSARATAAAAWTSLDLPVPTIHPGGQAGIHLSFVASRANPNVVFVGGDRQNNPFPNNIGANDFSGRLFRIDA